MATEFNSALGLRPGEEPGTLVLDPRPEHQVAPDVVHFAVLTALAEIAAARVAPLAGKGRVLRQGKRLAVAEGEVTQNGELVANAVGQFALVSPTPTS
jgi:acyl-coenzyme A thioesterase PaaI-like protein